MSFNKSPFVVIIIAIVLFGISCSKKSSTSNTPPPPVTQGPPYFPYVRTIIQKNCLTCHVPSGAGMPTILNTDTLIVQSAAAIKAAVNDPISPTNHRMPQGGTLSATDIATIVNWYNAGGASNVSGINKYP